MRHLIALIFSCFFLVVSSAGMAEKVTVNIQGFKFLPEKISINKGDSVTWINQDSALHSTTQDSGLWNSNLERGQSFNFVFNQAGTYTYYCTFHPSMRGTVTVSDTGAGDPKPCFFKWAESNYAQFFAPAGNDSFLSFPPYTYRYYSATDTYLAVSSADNHVYYMFGSDGVIRDAGPLSDWLTTSGCQ